MDREERKTKAIAVLEPLLDRAYAHHSAVSNAVSSGDLVGNDTHMLTAMAHVAGMIEVAQQIADAIHEFDPDFKARFDGATRSLAHNRDEEERPS